MENNFHSISKTIADRFLQNIIFIDDMAYKCENNSPQAFDSMEVTKAFALSGKLCTILAPETSEEFISYKELLMKADVIVLDWTLFFPKQKDKDLDLEEDAPDEEIHGAETLKIIRYLCEDCQKYKLIIVYTGDVNLAEITDTISKALHDLDGFKKDDYEVRLLNTTICVRAKADMIHGRFDYLPQFKQYVLPYDKLPDFILDKFTHEVCGLIPNFALNTLATIRENTFLILSKLSKVLDSAYIGHRITQDIQSDAKLMLTRMFGDAIIDLANSKDWDYSNLLKAWIEDFVIEPVFDGKSLSKETLSKLVDTNLTIEERMEIFIRAGFSKNKWPKYASLLYPVEGIDINQSNIEFAKLTHHKNFFKPSNRPPILSLGTVIMSINTENYYVCVQQRCDSLRIKEETRNFIFLPLIESGGKHPLLTDNGKTLAVDYTSYNIKIFSFKAINECVVAQEIKDSDYIFESSNNDSDQGENNEKFRWIVDLKDLHAQRIANEYCSQLSRVGLDESEWLRLHGKN